MRNAAAVLAAASILVVSHARADERPLGEAVTVASADECMTSAAVVEQLGSWLGRGTLDRAVTIVVEVGDIGAAFEILISGEPAGSRRFDRLPTECADRRAVVSLAIALALDDGVLDTFGSAVAREPSPRVSSIEPEAPIEPDASIEPEASIEPVPAAEPAPASVGVALEVEAAALFGLLFDPVLLGAVDVRLLLPEGVAVRVGIIVSGAAGASLGSGHVETSIIGGRVGVCLGRVVAAPVSLLGCVGAWVGAAHAEGRGFAADRSVELGLVAPAARIEARLEPLPWLALFVAVEGAVSVLRPRLLLEGSGAARDLGDVGIALSGGGALVLR